MDSGRTRLRDAEELENQLKFEQAGLLFIDLAESARPEERQAYYFMRAARCFEMEQAWRRTYFSWGFCAQKLNLSMKNGPDKSIDKTVLKRDNIPLRERFQPYYLTEERWKNPEEDTYKKHLGRSPNEDEKVKHRRAWAYDFAGLVAARNGQHGNAAMRYDQAAKAWLACDTFPENKLIAAKFFAFSACEAILALGSTSSGGAVDTIETAIQHLAETAVDDSSFPGKLRDKNHRNHIANRVASYCTAIRKHARMAGLRNIEEYACRLEHHFLRKHYWRTQQRRKLVTEWFMWGITGNGTSWLRLFSVTAILSVFVFPIVYFFLTKVAGSAFDDEALPAGVDVVTRFLNCVYFSIVTFATLGYGDFAPNGWMRVFAALEALFGYVFLGLFVFLLSRKMD